jgi:hypothetical protein
MLFTALAIVHGNETIHSGKKVVGEIGNMRNDWFSCQKVPANPSDLMNYQGFKSRVLPLIRWLAFIFLAA